VQEVAASLTEDALAAGILRVRRAEARRTPERLAASLVYLAARHSVRMAEDSLLDCLAQASGLNADQVGKLGAAVERSLATRWVQRRSAEAPVVAPAPPMSQASDAYEVEEGEVVDAAPLAKRQRTPESAPTALAG
jgi:hypothetical protein